MQAAWSSTGSGGARGGDAHRSVGKDPVHLARRIGIGLRRHDLHARHAQCMSDVGAAVGVAAGLGILADAVDDRGGMGW